MQQAMQQDKAEELLVGVDKADILHTRRLVEAADRLD